MDPDLFLGRMKLTRTLPNTMKGILASRRFDLKFLVKVEFFEKCTI